MKFEWDDDKNIKNYNKHGLSFEVASKVFEDPLAVYILDRIIDGEERRQAFGKVADLPLLVVAHSYRDSSGEETIRIISARYATSRERIRYEQNFYPAG